MTDLLKIAAMHCLALPSQFLAHRYYAIASIDSGRFGKYLVSAGFAVLIAPGYRRGF